MVDRMPSSYSSSASRSHSYRASGDRCGGASGISGSGVGSSGFIRHFCSVPRTIFKCVGNGLRPAISRLTPSPHFARTKIHLPYAVFRWQHQTFDPPLIVSPHARRSPGRSCGCGRHDRGVAGCSGHPSRRRLWPRCGQHPSPARCARPCGTPGTTVHP